MILHMPIVTTSFAAARSTWNHLRARSFQTTSRMAQPIQLYSLATPNGQKIGVVLEELGLPYEPHTIDIRTNAQFSDEYKKINPNSKIPAIVDPNGPDGKPVTVWESGAILLYLAEKTGRLLSSDPVKRIHTIQWLFFQMSGIGPMFGQFNHFNKYAPEKIPYAIDRYTKEAKRLLGVLDQQLEGQEYIVGEYSIADIATFTWVLAMIKGGASDTLEMPSFKNVEAWVSRCANRPASVRGLQVCAFPTLQK